MRPVECELAVTKAAHGSRSRNHPGPAGCSVLAGNRRQAKLRPGGHVRPGELSTPARGRRERERESEEASPPGTSETTLVPHTHCVGVPQVRGHGPQHHCREDLWLHLLAERRPGDRASCARHRVQLQPHLPPKPESRQDASAAGSSPPFRSSHTCRPGELRPPPSTCLLTAVSP